MLDEVPAYNDVITVMTDWCCVDIDAVQPPSCCCLMRIVFSFWQHQYDSKVVEKDVFQLCF